MKDKLMIDISMLLHRDSLNQLIALSNANMLGEFVISETFMNYFLEDNNFYRLRRLAPQIGVPLEMVEPASLYEFLQILKNQDSVTYYRNQEDKEIRFYQNLAALTGNELIARIFFDEYGFLISHSWLVSKSRKIYDTVIDAGAYSLQMSKHAFERVVRITLRKNNNDPLSPNDLIRAAGKWVAVSGGAVTNLITPAAGVVINLVTGMFLLYDP